MSTPAPQPSPTRDDSADQPDPAARATGLPDAAHPTGQEEERASGVPHAVAASATAAADDADPPADATVGIERVFGLRQSASRTPTRPLPDPDSRPSDRDPLAPPAVAPTTGPPPPPQNARPASSDSNTSSSTRVAAPDSSRQPRHAPSAGTTDVHLAPSPPPNAPAADIPGDGEEETEETETLTPKVPAAAAGSESHPLPSAAVAAANPIGEPPAQATADSSEPGIARPQAPPVRYEEFARVVRGKTKLLVLTHDNPDPDAMASAIGIYTILTDRFGIETFIGHGGRIARAENKAMVKELDLPIYALPLLGDLSSFEGIVLVDCQTEARYHSLPDGVTPLAVFDHHPVIAKPGRTPAGLFVEIQEDAGATATIITNYLLASGAPISPQVATALMYGIKSDTGDFSRHVFQWDLDAHRALFPLVDRKRLSEIELPALPREYFYELQRALGSAMIYGTAIAADMGEVENPDMISLVADLLLRLDTADWALAYGFYDREMRLSLRTSLDEGDAGRVIRKMIKRRGSGGGHGEMAAAQIPLTAQYPAVQYDIVAADLLAAYLEQVGESAAGSPLTRLKKHTST